MALYGSYAGYVVGAVALLILSLLIMGFRQGREINFWPPRIGPRAPADDKGRQKASGSRSDSPRRAALKGRITDQASKEFEVWDAQKFYRLIAENYDERNSANLLATHMETIERIEKVRAGKGAVRVLDLGGGTGQNIATHFFNDANIDWDYVDACPEMADQLRRKLAGRRLRKRLTIHLADIHNLRDLHLLSAGYDVILLSVVISSMEKLPDFSVISELLIPGGSLIISDINPDYTYAHPYYRVTSSDSKPVAMRMNPVRLLDLLNTTKSAGLRLTELTPIGDASPSYSFIASFEAAHQREELQGSQGMTVASS